VSEIIVDFDILYLPVKWRNEELSPANATFATVMN
jgi:hypothetical protein